MFLLNPMMLAIISVLSVHVILSGIPKPNTTETVRGCTSLFKSHDVSNNFSSKCARDIVGYPNLTPLKQFGDALAYLSTVSVLIKVPL